MHISEVFETKEDDEAIEKTDITHSLSQEPRRFLCFINFGYVHSLRNFRKFRLREISELCWINDSVDMIY